MTQHVVPARERAFRRDFASFSALQFLLAGCVVTTLFYQMMYLKSLGMSDLQAGLGYTVSGFASMAGRLIWSRLMDRFGHPKRIFLLMSAMALGATVLLWRMPKGSALAVYIVLAFEYFTLMPLCTVADAWFFKAYPDKGDYFGRVWLFYAAAVSVLPWGFGELLDRFGYDALFLLYIACAVSAAAVSLIACDLPRPAAAEQPGRRRDALLQLLQNRGFLLPFLLAPLLYFFGTLVFCFVPQVTQSVSGGVTLLGRVIIASGIMQVISSWVSPRLLKKYDPFILLGVSALCFAAEGVFNALATGELFCWIAMVFDGVGNAVMIITLRCLFSAVAEEKNRSTSIGFAEAAYAGIGGSVAGAAGGWLIDTVGLANEQYIGAAGSVLVGLLCLLMLRRRKPR